MLVQSWRARRAIRRNLTKIGYDIDGASWRQLKMGIARDLQARRLPANVKVPPRRNLISYIGTIRLETGSLFKALEATLYSGSWTSSGGSFRLAESLGIDLPAIVDAWLQSRGSVRFLEIGAGWAGLRTRGARDGTIRDIAGLAVAHPRSLGTALHLHFTNLTPWHVQLPAGCVEHAHVTAAGILVLEREGVERGSVDIIYSQAAVYFERDLATFLAGAAALLKPDGILIFNHRPELAAEVRDAASAGGLELHSEAELGGMNGQVVCFMKMPVGIAAVPDAAADGPEELPDPYPVRAYARRGR